MTTESRHIRTEILLGQAALAHLKQQHILVAGLGGVGGFAAEALARAGIGRLTLLDHDVIVPSNLNRQLLALQSTLGQKKAIVMAERLRDINPEIELVIADHFLQQNEAAEFVAQGHFNYVLDCIDSIACKAALVAACLRQQVKVASSMGAGNRLDVTQVKITQLNQTQGCGLARELRALLKQQQVRTNYPVVYSQEVPRSPLPHQHVAAGEGRPRATNGTISYLPGLFGLMLSGWVIKDLLAEME
ncbi:tRNA threonylcarbamoyladenosine dehydratase [Thioflexithrix psekupsensis]|uniref:tRNA threonylcarbamoyladenosine dehydratase n=1 Tax=Thioflexithrix psekupsensis TaxID=1570016 RepID=A0A251X607_9GAMM|nr:tRNA threonylcarbamoyladenosine dehydratase [Thioflexithrix psekupsensis]OUD13176.1 tRNA threonylcarbamoyladenosine dehydratase [Thioflexithrix psekupsensis]